MILKLIKHSYFWNKLRILKQVILSLNKDPQEKALQRKQQFVSSAEEVSKSKSHYFLQGRMDIDPFSYWHNPEFIKEYGGFLPKAIYKDKRNIVDTCSYDLVRRDMIILLLRTIVENEIKGEIAELGVYKGESFWLGIKSGTHCCSILLVHCLMVTFSLRWIYWFVCVLLNISGSW